MQESYDDYENRERKVFFMEMNDRRSFYKMMEFEKRVL